MAVELASWSLQHPTAIVQYVEQSQRATSDDCRGDVRCLLDNLRKLSEKTGVLLQKGLEHHEKLLAIDIERPNLTTETARQKDDREAAVQRFDETIDVTSTAIEKLRSISLKVVAPDDSLPTILRAYLAQARVYQKRIEDDRKMQLELLDDLLVKLIADRSRLADGDPSEWERYSSVAEMIGSFS